MERILLFLVAYADLRILPHPDFEWPAPWLTAMFAKQRFVTAERGYNVLLLVFVAGSPGIYSGTVILAGLRVWARQLASIHPVSKLRLIAPLLVSLMGYAQAEFRDLAFVLILVLLVCGSAIVKRRRRRRDTAATSSSYAVLHQSRQFR